MDLGALFLILAVLVLVGVFVSRPFLFQTTGDDAHPDVNPAEDQPRSALMAEHERILNALQELDFDQALGKIPEEEYPEQRAALLRSGADVLRRLDALQNESPRQSAEERIEAVIAARRADAGPADAQPALYHGPADEALEQMIARRRQTRQEKAAGFCPRCGKPVQKSDRFCPKCGAVLG